MTSFTNVFVLFVCAYAVVEGASDYALEDKEVQPIADFAVSELGPEYSLVEIKQRHMQQVQGLLYSLTLLVKNTIAGVVEFQICQVQVHYIPWLGTKELTRHTCSPQALHDLGPGFTLSPGHAARRPQGYRRRFGNSALARKQWRQRNRSHQ